MFFISTSGVPPVNKIDLPALTLAGPTGKSLVLDPLAVLCLDKGLYITIKNKLCYLEIISDYNHRPILFCFLCVKIVLQFLKEMRSINLQWVSE